MNEIKIEKSIPIPQARTAAGERFRIIKAMEIGDSITCPRSEAQSWNSAFRRVGFGCSVRKIDNQTSRVWKIAAKTQE